MSKIIYLIYYYSTVILLALIIGQTQTGYPPLDRQVCHNKRTELRDAFEAVLWRRSGHHGHVSEKNSRSQVVKAKINGHTMLTTKNVTTFSIIFVTYSFFSKISF
jgi:hypothetical protein